MSTGVVVSVVVPFPSSLTVAVVPPALDTAGRSEGARVAAAGRDGGDAARDTHNVHRVVLQAPYPPHVCGPELVPLPSSPLLLEPQHLTPPAVVRAQLWSYRPR